MKESRVIEGGFSVRRRRECDRCSFRFSTRELSEILDLAVVKKDSTREMYQREKMEAGVLRALVKRGKTPQAIRRLLARIEREIQKANKKEVTSKEIGRIVLTVLKKFDQVAYIRFASVYLSFEDVDDFQEEVKTLKRRRRTARKKN